MNKYSLAFLLFFFCFVIYNLNVRTIGAGDTIPSGFLPFNILTGNSVYFDKLYLFLNEHYTAEKLYFFQKFNDHYISSYPLISGFLTLPLYILPYLYMSHNNLLTINNLLEESSYLEKISASFFTSLSVVVFYFLMFQISKKISISLIFSLIFAFATQTFSISSQALWQHTSANLFLIISQFSLIKGMQSKNRAPFYIYAFVFAILSFWSRLQFLPYLIILFIALYFLDRKNTNKYFMICFFGILAFIIYNLYFYSSILGGYAELTKIKPKGDFIKGILGLLFSPARGTLFYTPFFMFSFLSVNCLGLIKVFKEKIFYLQNIIFFIVIITFSAFWGAWWGGHTWGNRLLTDIAYQAVILSYLFYKCNKNRIISAIFILLVGYSIFTQILGVFVFPKTGWNQQPSDIDHDTKRLWDFYDSPIIRSIKQIAK